ncbi:DUF397 domain-containing protein [Nocardia sp. CA-129566]
MNIYSSEGKWFKSSRSSGNDTCVEVAHLVRWLAIDSPLINR